MTERSIILNFKQIKMKSLKKTIAFTAVLLNTIAVNGQTKNKKIMKDYHETAKTQFISANGTPYAYRVLGDDAGIPLIMFQHFTGTMDNWDPAVTNGLAAHFKVIIFDNKGIGATQGKTPDNIADQARDAEDFIKALGYTKVNLFGFSMGGFIAQQVALDQPGLVNKIILAGTGPKGGEGLAEITGPLTEAQKMKSDEEVKLFLFYSDTKTSRESGKQSLNRIYKRQKDRDPETKQEAVMAQLNAILKWAQPDEAMKTRLNTITHPVLVVNGNNDTMVPTINSYIMFQNLPNAKLTLYPDSGHGAIFQYFEDFLAEAVPFLKK